MSFDLSADERGKIWPALIEGIETYLAEAAAISPARPVEKAAVDELLADLDFDRPVSAEAALELALRGLREFQHNSRHPRSFGFFEAAPTTMSIVGDVLAATFNGCLASRDGSPFGIAAEEKLVTAFGTRFGYAADEVDGVVTSGGSESNFSAMLLALTHGLPGYGTGGLPAVTRRPVVYVSPEAHPSVPRAVRLAGLGTESVRVVETDRTLRMDLTALEKRVIADQRDGFEPLAVVVTAGTTGAGVIDPLDGAADIAVRHRLWLHVDAAWGGAPALLTERGPAFRGLARADSVTFDPHKWMSVPLGIGLLLTRHRGLLERTFAIGPSFLDPADDGASEPFNRSLRWSRSFAALKVLLTLAVAGWQGFEDTLQRQVRLGDELRHRLATSGWRIVNDTPLPVVCFVPDDPADAGLDGLRLLANIVNATGQARVAVVRIGARHALRACITNHATISEDIEVLGQVLADAARTLRSGQPVVNVGDAAPAARSCEGGTA